MSASGHHVIQHMPGEKLLCVQVSDGTVVEITKVAGQGLQRRENGGAAKSYITLPDSESAMVLDALAASYRGGDAPQAGLAPVRGRMGAGTAFGAGLSLAIVVASLLYGGYAFRSSQEQPFTAAKVAVNPPAIPDVIPSGHSYAEKADAEPAGTTVANGLPTPTPNVSTGASRSATAPVKSAPPAVALPGDPAPAPAKVAKADEPRSSRIDTASTNKPVAPPESDAAKVAASDASAGGGLQARALDVQAKLSVANDEAKKQVQTKGADSAADEVKRMQAALDSLERGDKLAPDVVAQLPHEIAQRLREAGAVMSDEDLSLATKAAGGPEFKIVRLPPGAVDKFRDKDGIASIPETNSWAATGGNIRLPLPGGGEIKSAREMAELFKLKM